MSRHALSGVIPRLLTLVLVLWAIDSVQGQTEEPVLERIIDFRSLPDRIETNISTFVISASTEPGRQVTLNGRVLLPGIEIGASGTFVVVEPLSPGDNVLRLIIESSDGELFETVEKTVNYDAAWSTGDKRLVYVDAVALNLEDMPEVSGTFVIDLDNDSLLGLLVDQHIRGIAPDSSEIYMSDRAVVSTDTHQEIRRLPFTEVIPSNGFIVSPNGLHLYSRNERVEVSSNTLGVNLPISIVTGSSWSQAPIPGGPTISSDSRYIYCSNNVKVIDTIENTVFDPTDPDVSGHFMSDITLTPDDRMLLVSEYSFANGRLKKYQLSGPEPVDFICRPSGLGDFSGKIVVTEDSRWAIVGSSGNPQSATNGRVTVIDLMSCERILPTFVVPLGDNLAISEQNEVFVSVGMQDQMPENRRLGVDVFLVGEDGMLMRMKTFFLGINGFTLSTGRPKYDQIRRIVYKPIP